MPTEATQNSAEKRQQCEQKQLSNWLTNGDLQLAKSNKPNKWKVTSEFDLGTESSHWN